MWDALVYVIHLVVVAALGLVGVTVDADPAEEERDAAAERVALMIWDAPSTAAPLSFVNAPAAGPHAFFGEPSMSTAVYGESCGKAKARPGVPLFIEEDEIAS